MAHVCFYPLCCQPSGQRRPSYSGPARLEKQLIRSGQQVVLPALGWPRRSRQRSPERPSNERLSPQEGRPLREHIKGRRSPLSSGRSQEPQHHEHLRLPEESIDAQFGLRVSPCPG